MITTAIVKIRIHLIEPKTLDTFFTESYASGITGITKEEARQEGISLTQERRDGRKKGY